MAQYSTKNHSSSQFIQDFNNVFEQNKIRTAFDKGYGEQMIPHNDYREEININNKIGKYNHENFNRQFDQTKIITDKKIVKYSEPEALISCNYLGFSDIGLSKVEDFSANSDNSLNFTDYMKAYSNSHLIDPSLVKLRPEYKNIDEIEAERSNITYKMTEEEERKNKEKEKREKKKEIERLKYISRQDRRYNEQYNKVNTAMLAYRK